MSLKVIGLCLSAMLLVQCIQARSTSTQTANNIDAIYGATADEPAVNVLLVFIGTQFNTIIDKALKSGDQLVRDVIADVSTTNQTQDMQTNIAGLTNYLSESVKSNNLAEKMVNMNELLQLLQYYNSTGVEQPKAAVLLIETSLKKNGQQALDDNLKADMKNFMSDFHKELADHWVTLSTVEQDKNTTFNNWYKDFKNVDNEGKDKQSELLRKFMDLS